MRIEPLRPAHAGRACRLCRGSACARAGRGRAGRAGRARSSAPDRRPRAGSTRGSSSGAVVSSGRPSIARLRLLIRELRRRAHHDAVERVAPLAPVRADDHAHGQRRPVFVRAQRAEVVGDALGQHRHDAVGEIDRIAALQRLAVERRARRARNSATSAMATVSTKPPGLAGSASGAAWTASSWSLASGGSMVTSGSARQSSRCGQRRGPRLLGFVERGGGEDMGDVVGGERDQADRALGVDRAEPFDDARRRQRRSGLRATARARRGRLPAPRRQAGGNEDFARRAALFDRQHAAAAVLQLAIDAEHACARAIENFDDAAGVGGIARAGDGVEFDAHQHPRANARRGARSRLESGRGGRGCAAPRRLRSTRPGAATSSPSRSRSTMSATTIAGSRPWRDEHLAAARDRAVGFEISAEAFSASLSSPLTAKARAMSRLVTRVGGRPSAAPPLAIKATTSSREGKAPATRAARERGLARAAVLDGLLFGNFWVWRWGRVGSAPARLSTIGGPPLQARRSGAARRAYGAAARLPITSRVNSRSGASSRRSISSASGWAAIQSPTAANGNLRMPA